MGELVKAKLLRPLDDYAKVYGWADRYSPTLLDLNRFSPDGNEFGSGDLYGLSQMGEIVGVYYNKEKVPTPPTKLAEFEASLEEAKAAGETPIMFGNLEKWPGIHNFESVLGQFADKQAVRDFVFAKEGANFDTPEFQEAATKIQEWVDKGYFNKNFNGTDYDPAWQQFAKGDSRYLIAGTWLTADLAKEMGDNVGFMLLPGNDPNAPVVARRREPAVLDHVGVEEPGRGGGVHRLPHRRQRGQGARRHRQPAGRDAGRPGAGQWRVRGDRSGLGEAQPGRRHHPVPRLRDADGWRRHRRRDPGTAGEEAVPDGVHRRGAGEVQRVGGVPLT